MSGTGLGMCPHPTCLLLEGCPVLTDHVSSFVNRQVDCEVFRSQYAYFTEVALLELPNGMRHPMMEVERLPFENTLACLLAGSC